MSWSSSMAPVPADVVDVYLSTGEFHFGGGQTRIRTVLGTCVAITLWHPQRRLGGMCHYMLPARSPVAAKAQHAHGLYADEALELFRRDLIATRTQPRDYVVKIFGGGNMFAGARQAGNACQHKLCAAADRLRCHDVACKNVQTAHDLLIQHGYSVTSQSVGGYGCRQVVFDVWSGDVWVRRGPPLQCGAAASA